MRIRSNACRMYGLAAGLLVAGTGSALAEVHYVDLNSTNATTPYTNWAIAATDIETAVDAAAAGDEVVVTNGDYYPVWVTKLLDIRSVNGPQSTTIHGDWDVPYSGCVYLTNGASLSGFTLTGGHDGLVTYDGAGAYGGTLNNCVLCSNICESGGTGGGAYNCTLNNCTLSGNRVVNSYLDLGGGGARFCTLNNCILTGNSADEGGGASECTLRNCTLVGNWAGKKGGGAYFCELYNCILYYNTPQVASDENTLSYCCAAPSPGITNPPLFVDTNGWANLRLQSNSPCINAGNDTYAPAGPDLDGNPRIVGGTVDIGAYEFQAPVSQISYAWLQQYGLPITNSTDTADPDGDGVDNYHEWLASTDPTNPLSSPAQLTIPPSPAGAGPSGVIVTWSTNAVGFTLQSATTLAAPVVWTTNASLPVVLGAMNVVTNPLSGPQQFYRLAH